MTAMAGFSEYADAAYGDVVDHYVSDVRSDELLGAMARLGVEVGADAGPLTSVSDIVRHEILVVPGHADDRDSEERVVSTEGAALRKLAAQVRSAATEGVGGLDGPGEIAVARRCPKSQRIMECTPLLLVITGCDLISP